MYVLLVLNLVGIAVIIIITLLRRSSTEGAKIEQALREELRAGRAEASNDARGLRDEVGRAQNQASETIMKLVTQLGADQKVRLDDVVKGTSLLLETNRNDLNALRTSLETRLLQIQETNDAKLSEMRKTLDNKMSEILKNNEEKLERMRQTVDEKLHSTLERRLGESFKLVSDRLEAVQRGLGEMQNLATGVGDLKRVLTNVRDRGTWGEIQLEAILEQILTKEQYEKNVRTKEDSRESVEFAIKLPGRGNNGEHVWLPIDSKFPREDYERLVEASQKADTEGVKSASDALARRINSSAKDIRDKYLNPPKTTDFAIMFLPTEGLYAEVLRNSNLHDQLQNFKIIPAGPTTLTAILNSLRLGFRTLAIEKRSSEVWDILAAVKAEFGRFGEVLSNVKKQLNTVSKTIDKTSQRTRAMEKKLRSVEELPSPDAEKLLELPPGESNEETEEDSE